MFDNIILVEVYDMQAMPFSQIVTGSWKHINTNWCTMEKKL